MNLYGAQGGSGGANSPGGLGAEVSGTLSATAGQTLQINVGGAGGTTGGFNGGGTGGGYSAGGGGGGTDVRGGVFGLADRLLAAGGGGGGGGTFASYLEGGSGGNAGAAGVTGAPGAATNNVYLFWFASQAAFTAGASPIQTDSVGAESTHPFAGGGGAGGDASGGNPGASGEGLASTTGSGSGLVLYGVVEDSPTPSGTELTSATSSCLGDVVSIGISGAVGGTGAGGSGNYAAGGGGGYFGGGGGGGGAQVGCVAVGGGGGGSSYLGSATATSGPTPSVAPDDSSNGEAIITYADPLTAGSPDYTALPGQTLIVNSPVLLSGASGPLNDTLSALAATNEATSAGGSVTIGVDGSFSYTPPSSLTSGTDTFPFTVTDGVDSVVGTASVLVGPPAVSIDKQISVDGGATWLDVGNGNLAQDPNVLVGSTVDERVIVTDTGDLGLTGVSVSDVIGSVAAPGFTFGGASDVSVGVGQTVISDIATFTASAGYQLDTATVTGTVTDSGGSTATVSASDQANYTGVVAPSVVLSFSGSLTYHNGGTITMGSLDIEPSNGAIRTITGTITIPGASGGSATIRVEIYHLFGFYLGTIRVDDPSAHLHTIAIVFSQNVDRTSTGTVTGTAIGLYRGRPFTLNFTI